MKFMNNKITIVFILVLLAVQGCTKDTTPKSTPEKKAGSNFGSLPFVIQDNYTFSLYSQVLTATGYGDTLALNAGPYTLFVPNDDGFSNAQFYFGNGTNYLLYAFNPSTLDYVRGMIIPQQLSMKNLPMGANQPFRTLGGGSVYITKYREQAGDTVITVNGVPLLSTGWDQPATNGTINVLTGIPEPTVLPNLWQLMLNDGALSFFTLAIQRAGLQSFFEDTTKKLTVLAPSNQGLANMYVDTVHGGLDLRTIDAIKAADPDSIKKLVLYHVLNGFWFLNDFKLRDTIPGDTVQLISFGGAPLGYSGRGWIGTRPVPQPVFNYNTYTYDTVLALLPVGTFSRFSYDMPRVTYTDKICNNGVVQELNGVLMQ
jgi:uncharacterized surface protein with fasciclin (FAS1) repeats